MYNAFVLTAVGTGILIIFVLLAVGVPRWVFRVDEQIKLLKQIAGELRRLNEAAADKRG